MVKQNASQTPYYQISNSFFFQKLMKNTREIYHSKQTDIHSNALFLIFT